MSFLLSQVLLGLILRDTSSKKHTQVKCLGLGNDSIYQLQGDPRQRVLLEKHQIVMHIGHAQFRIVWQAPKEPGPRYALEQAKAAFASKQVASELDLTLPNLHNLPSTAYELRSRYTPSVASQYQRLPIIFHERQRWLGSGSFGTVHETVDLGNGNLLAVKTSKHGVGDNGHRESLKQEVEILAKLSHPNIVRFIHSQGWKSGSPVEIFMSLYEGSLTALIPPHKCDAGLREQPSFCESLAKQVLHAIAYLHTKGITYGDIKPENTLYDHNGEGSSLTFYVSDFGLSKEQISTSSRVPVGSPFYMAPEINQGNPHTGKSDIWSFAVMMLEVFGYFCLEESKLTPEKWKDRVARLHGYRSNLTLETDHGPAVSLSSWKHQLRWYERIRSLVQLEVVPLLLRPLLAEDVETRLDAQQCLSSLFPEQKPTTPKTIQLHLEGPPHTSLSVPRIRELRQDHPNLDQRIQNDQRSAVPMGIVITAPRALRAPRAPRDLRSIRPLA